MDVNRSLHLFFAQLAEAFNEAGLDIKAVLSKNIEHPWNVELIKELMWRRVQNSMFHKKSTTKLTTQEINEIYDVINKFIGENFNIYIPFPSLDNLLLTTE